MDDDEVKRTHAPILALQAKMKNDVRFKALCERHGLPWDFAAGYEPRGYNGPAPERTKLLILLAEPGAITPTEARNLLPGDCAPGLVPAPSARDNRGTKALAPDRSRRGYSLAGPG
jgi:hypothetical protein